MLSDDITVRGKSLNEALGKFMDELKSWRAKHLHEHVEEVVVQAIIIKGNGVKQATTPPRADGAAR